MLVRLQFWRIRVFMMSPCSFKRNNCAASYSQYNQYVFRNAWYLSYDRGYLRVRSCIPTICVDARVLLNVRKWTENMKMFLYLQAVHCFWRQKGQSYQLKFTTGIVKCWQQLWFCVDIIGVCVFVLPLSLTWVL